MSALIFFLLHLFRTDPPIIVARDTTYITSPLRPDGLPDYEAYMRERNRKGVTPDNNAAVPLWIALWPMNLEPEHRELMRAELGLKKTPSAKAALAELFGDANRKRVTDWLRKQRFNSEELDPDEFIDPAISHSWTSRQFPPLAEWVEANKQPLDLIVAASRRPRYYSPSPTLLDKRHDLLFSSLLPAIQNMREAARALSVRAMRHIGENRLHEAWTDLLAIHRLARLTAQGHTLVEHLVAMAIDGIACQGTLVLLSSDRLTGDLATRINNDLAELSMFANVVQCLDGSERVGVLDAIIHMKLYGIDAMSDGTPRRGRDIAKHMPVDWNIALRRVNYWFDRLIATTKLPTREARNKSYAKFEADLSADSERVKNPLQIIIAAFSLNRRSELIGAIIAGLLMPAFDAAITAEDRTNTTLQLTRVAASLAVYRAKHRRYPATLDNLIPTLLKKLPTDSYHSKPLIYKRTEDGYLLYSAGENGVDDHGDNSLMSLLAGRSVDELFVGKPQDSPPEVPADADDISVRLPRPAFRLPKAARSSDGIN